MSKIPRTIKMLSKPKNPAADSNRVAHIISISKISICMIFMLIGSKFMHIQGAVFSVDVLSDCIKQIMFSLRVIQVFNDANPGIKKNSLDLLGKEPTSRDMMMLAVRQACQLYSQACHYHGHVICELHYPEFTAAYEHIHPRLDSSESSTTNLFSLSLSLTLKFFRNASVKDVFPSRCLPKNHRL